MVSPQLEGGAGFKPAPCRSGLAERVTALGFVALIVLVLVWCAVACGIWR